MRSGTSVQYVGPTKYCATIVSYQNFFVDLMIDKSYLCSLVDAMLLCTVIWNEYLI